MLGKIVTCFRNLSCKILSVSQKHALGMTRKKTVLRVEEKWIKLSNYKLFSCQMRKECWKKENETHTQQARHATPKLQSR